jgi:hypothetical protein
MAKGLSVKVQSNIEEFLAEVQSDFVAISEAAAQAIVQSIEYGKKLAREEAFLDARENFTDTYQQQANAAMGRFYRKRRYPGLKTPHPEGNKPGSQTYRRGGKRYIVPRVYHRSKIMMRRGDLAGRFVRESYRTMLKKERKIARAELVTQPRRKGGGGVDRMLGEPVYMGTGGHRDMRSYVVHDGKKWLGVVDVIGNAGKVLRVLEYGSRIDLNGPNTRANRKGQRVAVGNAFRKGMRRFASYMRLKK